MKPQRMDIDSEALAEFKKSLSAALEIVTCRMIRKNMNEGTVSAKVKIRIEECADAKTGELYYMMDIEPDVKMKIGEGDSLRCGKKGGIVMKQDGTGRPVIASQQISMNDIAQEGA